MDWCEDNYTHSPHIAEFVNTVSNGLFFLLPPLLIRLHCSYAAHCGRGIHLVWLLLIVVGASLTYFHATLSLTGQLLDELAILWVVVASYWLWFPQSCVPAYWREQPDGRARFCRLFVPGAAVTTLLGTIQPAVNAYCLMLLAIPSLALLLHQLRPERSPLVLALARRSIWLWGAAIGCWVGDRFFCDFWASLGFPYLHGAWHILIFLASYTAIVLFAYFEVKNNMKSETPVLRYYPSDHFQLGVPYVLLKRDLCPLEELGGAEGNNNVEAEGVKEHCI